MERTDDMTDEEWDAWPKCAVPACQHKSCRALASRYCWTHTPGDAQAAQENLRETETARYLREYVDRKMQPLYEAYGKPAFNPDAECSPTLTQCPRCNNPHHACDGGIQRLARKRAKEST